MKPVKYIKINKNLFLLIFSISLLFSECFHNLSKNEYSNENLSNDSSILIEGIYMKGLIEKNKKERAISNSFSMSNLELSKYSSGYQKVYNGLPNLPSNNAISEVDKNVPILYQTWVKFFKYTNQNLNINTPKEFFKNHVFYEQIKFFPNISFEKTNQDRNYQFIRNENYFYLSIFKNAFVFNTSKKVILTNFL